MGALELRLEYMGSPALLARVSRLAAALRDAWTPRSHHKTNTNPRPPTILLHGRLSWHQLQLLMSRSTTPDLLKMQLKLEEFFTQQFNSSRRVFSSLKPGYAPLKTHRREQSAASGSGGGGGGGGGGGEPVPQQELRHHRHWQKVLRLLTNLIFPTPLPATGTVLGGTMELQGSNISLACFHGNSFKAKSWALFSLKDPCITFATEAQQVVDDNQELEVRVVQSLTASLGTAGAGSGAGGAGHQSMATVCRMTRALLFPPQFKALHEWFAYAFATSEIDAIELFPSLEREGAGNTNSAERDRGKGGGSEQHTREVIFAVPSLQLLLRTRHRQGDVPPTEKDEKPVVECSFITEFEDHIFVSVDAEAFLFLHDLISSYIKEKDRLMSGRGAWGEGSNNAGVGAGAGEGGSWSHDYREYNCLTWHLEPTVRLLSWAGKSIEPYGVDYILQKLGFRHARTTIPKWLQRGALDPLDALLAMLLRRLLAMRDS